MMSRDLKKTLAERTLILDGAFGTYLDLKGVKVESEFRHSDCIEYLTVFSPQTVSGIHAEYLESGADALETNTFGANVIKLAEYGLEAQAYKLNLESTQLAREQADKYSTPSWPRYVIGTMGPTGKLPSSTDPSLGDITYRGLKDIYRLQASAIIDGGADALLVETGQDLLEMKAAVSGIREALTGKNKDLVIMAHATLSNNGRMLLGTEVSAFMAVMCPLGVDVIGLNCGTGPDQMENSVSFLCEKAPCFVSCVPNAGLPVEENGKTIYPMGPSEMADILARQSEKYQLDVVGGCCGTTPAHIKALRDRIKKYPKRGMTSSRFYASSYKGFDLSVKQRPLIVGERMNTQGSRKMKRMVERSEYESIIELGRLQERQGADMLDLCVALTGDLGEADTAMVLTKRLAESVEVPLMIDSTDPLVIDKSLESYSGTAFINSINLEDGGGKAAGVFQSSREHGAFIVCLAIDENGMARTVAKKLQIAERIYQMAVKEHSIDPSRLVFDLLTFTLATGEKEYINSASETIEAIKRLKKKYPCVLTTLGISNVSFGLSPVSRKVLNMTFLGHAVTAGLDMAIVDPAGYLPIKEIGSSERELAEAMIFNNDPAALERFINYFCSRTDTTDTDQLSAVPGSSDLPIQEKISECVLSRDSARIIPLMEEALRSHTSESIINDILMKTMQKAGEKLDSGEMVLPYVLQAAEIMRTAVEYLENYIPGCSKGQRGSIILATVEGDVHDIGKNLVKMIFSNNGFKVIDLGKQVPVNLIVKAVKEKAPDALGLSALLVSTSRHMRRCVEALAEEGVECPVIVGGAPVNDKFAMDIARLPGGDFYRGGVFYAKDAFSGLKIITTLTEESSKKRIMAEHLKAAGPDQPDALSVPPPVSSSVKSVKRTPCGVLIEPPFHGIRALNNIPVDDVLEHIDKRALFELSWGAGIKSPGEKEALISSEFEPLFKQLKEDVIRKGWLDLKAVYGYFKCVTNGRTMEVLGADGKKSVRFDFEQTPNGGSLTDHFMCKDLAIFQAVTVGDKLSSVVSRLSDEGKNSKAFYIHGLGVNLAEALASYVHSRIRKELGIPSEAGKRLSPGYPIWRDLKDQLKIFQLLEVSRRIGVYLTEDLQMVPEQSTTAIIIPEDII